ncbi:DUF5074 domain-containing protein [uncultured Prevotella sp.]|uniref:DUF5074 domain-containing protein n=1 Tax=uncultured Prevotella sp. TaxID=159272 RepID=UPI0025FEF84A|nr:DUF5074 domain-containing protein [uncultured Prevotella sp.]
MKKKIYLLLFALLSGVFAFAQTIKVQGVPRNIKNGTIMMSPTDNTCDVDFSKITRWIGEGDKQAALVVKWNDSREERLYVWGYRWTDDADGTGAAMLCNVAKNDPNFIIIVYGDTPYGAAIGGVGYDFDGDGFSITKDGKAVEPEEDGTLRTTSYDFDNYASADEDDLWFSGWYNGYLSYWVCDKTGEMFGYSGVGASGRKLVDGCVDGWSAVRDMSNMNMGNMEGELYYLPALTSEPVQVDYSKGTFIVNEDWYGHQNSTLNFLTDDGEWIYRVIQKENPGVEIGATAQYGAIYGDKFFVMAKQPKDPGASITGGRITVCDAKTMKVLKQIENIAVDDNGSSIADGRGFLGVDEHKAYVGTSNGIYVLDLDKLEITGSVGGAGTDSDDPYQQLYGGQIGNMVRVNDRVFAVHQKNGLLVINPATDEVEQTVEAPEGWGFGSVVLSKDGNLWLSLAASSGSGQADTRIVKLNPATLEQTVIECPEGIFGPANSWYAWTPDCFCASKQNNVLYWNGGNSSWFSGKTVYKYDIDSNTFSTFIDYNDDPDGWQIYGCSFRIDPVTDEAIVSLYKGYGDPTYVVRKYDNEGKQIAEYSMISNYWFPSLPVFPDNEAPVVADIDPVSLTTEDGTTVSLKDVATDADNMDAAIVKTVKEVSDEEVLKAEMADGDLVITPLKAGKADITIQINSNGKLAETVVSVEVTEATDIDAVEGVKAEGTGRYTLDGKMLNAPQRGINIIRMSDGTIKKVIVR